MRHIYFGREDSAMTWYVNHVSGLRTWDAFEADYMKMFTSTFRREKAELLRNRIQDENESVLMYAQEAKRLFCRVDQSMS